MRISRTIKNKTTYDSLRTLFSYTSGDITGKRTNGTINEQAFDVVIINKNAKKVSLVRIGAPADNGGGAELEVREQTYA